MELGCREIQIAERKRSVAWTSGGEGADKGEWAGGHKWAEH